MGEGSAESENPCAAVTPGAAVFESHALVQIGGWHVSSVIERRSSGSDCAEPWGGDVKHLMVLVECHAIGYIVPTQTPAGEGGRHALWTLPVVSFR